MVLSLGSFCRFVILGGNDRIRSSMVVFQQTGLKVLRVRLNFPESL
jgi:hypothetical protein